MARRYSPTVALHAPALAFTLHEYAHDPRAASYGLEAAEALGLDPEQVFKTLLAALDGELVVAVVPVAGRLDLKALARALGGSKAALAEPKAAERATGYVTGGISPVGQKRAPRTVVDETAAAYDLVYRVGGPVWASTGNCRGGLVAATVDQETSATKSVVTSSDPCVESCLMCRRRNRPAGRGSPSTHVSSLAQLRISQSSTASKSTNTMASALVGLAELTSR